MKLPPMNALRAFEVVSRHLSVSRAAEEMCVSQGAVSQHVRNLEDYLGRDLFTRSKNRLTLTSDGENFAAVVQNSLLDISIAVKEVENRKCVLAIKAMSTLSSKWLLPRLESFYKNHPDVTVSLNYESIKKMSSLDGCDGAICFGDGNFDGLDRILLIQIRFYAVASPGYIEKYGKIEDLLDPIGHTLIEFSYKGEHRTRGTLWKNLLLNDVVDPNNNYIELPDTLQVLNAVMNGQGVGLLPLHLIENEIRSGAVEYISEQSIPSPFDWYFVSPSSSRPNTVRDSFRDWLVYESEPYREE